jgi:Protein of unknown function (DUF3237)
MAAEAFDFPTLASEPLCLADFQVEGGILSMGQSPWTARRIGYVTGGRFEGARLSGDILPGGGNWSTSGEIAPGVVAGTFDARVIWKTDDGALIYVTYTGRSVVSEAVAAQFRDPARSDTNDRADQRSSVPWAGKMLVSTTTSRTLKRQAPSIF